MSACLMTYNTNWNSKLLQSRLKTAFAQTLVFLVFPFNSAHAFEVKDWDGVWVGKWGGSADTSVTIKAGRVTIYSYQGASQRTGDTEISEDLLTFGIGEGYKIEIRPDDLDEASATYTRGDAKATAILFRAKRPDAVSDQPVAKELDIKFIKGDVSKLDPQELFQNGRCHETGKCATKSDEKAAKWYRQAADLGQADALRNLAEMYASGRGIKEDQQEATRLFLAAASQGDAQALYILGKSRSQDKATKVYYLRLAASQNHQDAIALLNEMNVSAKGDPGVAEQLAKMKKHAQSDVHEIEVIIDKSANFEVIALKGNTVLWKSGLIGAKKNIFISKMPRAKTKTANKICVKLGKGWIVRDKAGKAYETSCFETTVTDLLIGKVNYELKVEKK